MNVDRLFSDDFKHAIGVHQKIDRRLIHVEDETPVAVTAAEDNAAHVIHLVKSFTLNFGGGRCAVCVPI